MCAQLRSLELAQWEGSLHIGTKYWFFFVLKCEIGISISLYIKKKSQTKQQNCASRNPFVRVFCVYFNVQRFCFVPLLSLALMPFLLPLQELVLLIFSLGRWAVVSVVNSKKAGVIRQPPHDLCAFPQSSVPLQPPHPLFVWTKSVGWGKNFQYLKLKEGVNKGCLTSSPLRF